MKSRETSSGTRFTIPTNLLESFPLQGWSQGLKITFQQFHQETWQDLTWFLMLEPGGSKFLHCQHYCTTAIEQEVFANCGVATNLLVGFGHLICWVPFRPAFSAILIEEWASGVGIFALQYVASTACWLEGRSYRFPWAGQLNLRGWNRSELMRREMGKCATVYRCLHGIIEVV